MEAIEEPPGISPATVANGAGPHPRVGRRPGEIPADLSVSAEQWNDWHWHMHNRISSLEAIRRWVNLTPDEEEAIARRPDPPFAITPYWASLIDPDDPDCPIRKQVIPRTEEFLAETFEEDDSLHEDQMSPVPGLVHRYPDRVLILATDQCVAYCRYCTRGRLVGTGREPAVKARFDAMLEYLRRTPQVRDVLISGGDGLFMATANLEYLVGGLRAIPHIEIIRFGSRVPVFLPQRIADELVQMLRRYHPVWVNIHVNHPREVTPEVRAALARLADGGIPLGAQTVLLAGVNDCPNVMRRLMHELLKARVRPYYIYQADLVSGTAHFRTPVSAGLEIIEKLRGHTTGFAVPTYVIDAPGGGGKIPVNPHYMISQSPREVVLRNFEGRIFRYPEVRRYTPHDPTRCPECRAAAQHQELVPSRWADGISTPSHGGRATKQNGGRMLTVLHGSGGLS